MNREDQLIQEIKNLNKTIEDQKIKISEVNINQLQKNEEINDLNAKLNLLMRENIELKKFKSLSENKLQSQKRRFEVELRKKDVFIHEFKSGSTQDKKQMLNDHLNYYKTQNSILMRFVDLLSKQVNIDCDILKGLCSICESVNDPFLENFINKIVVTLFLQRIRFKKKIF
ncbi:hypothetical protein HERIO_822 [Hepatospora eriocheir]|uniref:Uncharacterized protein n=1 Tax=Hepatospora eriocheir TaxID=1081669 RepID=A0A1X0QBZ4_9MICR|nr:hypothetical protein HERIO_822 [Hepatospora eriocheir]